MFFKIGKYQAWIERTRHMDWKPHIERHNGAAMLWFLNLHVICDKAG